MLLRASFPGDRAFRESRGQVIYRMRFEPCTGDRMRGHRTAWRIGTRKPADHLILARIPDERLSGLIAAFPGSAGSNAGESRDPHITLFGPFFPGGSIGPIEEIIGRSLSDACSLTCHEADLVRLRGRRGGAIALGVCPSDDLLGFYREIVARLPPFVSSCSWIDRPPGNRLFHVSLRFNIPFHLFERVWEKASLRLSTGTATGTPGQPAGCCAPVNLFRAAIMRRGMLWKEYDIPRRAWLSRGEAGGPDGWAATRACFRKRAGFELSAPARRAAGSRFAVADLHLGDPAVIGSCHRPFTSCEEMDRVLIANWNYTVGPGDEVYYLGDHGRSHDTSPGADGWKELQGTIHRIGNETCTIMHDGIRFTIGDPGVKPLQEGWLLHGHVAGPDGKSPPFLDGETRSVNISLELVNYAPVSLDEICGFARRAGPGERIPTLNEARSRYRS